MTPADLERFYCKVDMDGPTMPHMDTPCHIWKGHCTKKGYGQFWLQGAARLANRVACVIAGKITLEDERMILHACDNPPCVNPQHLTPGTNRENVDDKLEKGRQPRRYSDEQIRTLRAISRDMALKNVALLFGCHVKLVSGIKNRRYYQNVTDGEDL